MHLLDVHLVLGEDSTSKRAAGSPTLTIDAEMPCLS
jgi:hypothetical protein